MESPGGVVSRGRLLDGRLSIGWSLFFGLGWPLAFMVMVAVEPAPADPDAAAPLLVELAGLALFLALGTTMVAALSRLPVAALSGVVTGLLAAAFSISCPATGHHGIGLWWVAQIGVIAIMLVLSFVALLQRPPLAGRTGPASGVGDAREHRLDVDHRSAVQGFQVPHPDPSPTVLDRQHLDQV